MHNDLSSEASALDKALEAFSNRVLMRISRGMRMTNAGKKALEELVAGLGRCEHDGGFDREIGPIGCMLGDKCVCAHTARASATSLPISPASKTGWKLCRSHLSSFMVSVSRRLEARATAAEKRVKRLEAALTELVDAQSNDAGLQAEGKEARLLLNDMACIAEDILNMA